MFYYRAARALQPAYRGNEKDASSPEFRFSGCTVLIPAIHTTGRGVEISDEKRTLRDTGDHFTSIKIEYADVPQKQRVHHTAPLRKRMPEIIRQIPEGNENSLFLNTSATEISQNKFVGIAYGMNVSHDCPGLRIE